MLRDYQVQAKNELYKRIKLGKESGKKKFILTLPTGAGKTTIFCSIIKDVLTQGKNILVVVDATRLIDQCSNRLSLMGIKHGFIKAGRKEDRDRKVQLCSIQTIINREFPPADVVIIDECHVSYSTSYQRLYETYKDKLFIGFTATPERTNPYESLWEIYDELITPVTIADLVDMGYLVPYRCFVLPEPDLQGIKITKGDYEINALERAMIKSELLQRAVDEWVRLGESRPTLAFCVTIDHCQALSQQFNKQGITADWIAADTSDKERNRKFKALVNGSLKILTSINTISKGVDIPEVSCILGCRPTQSRALFIQAAGRGGRPAPGKDDCIYIDQAGNIHRFGITPTDYIPPELTPPKSRKDKSEMAKKTCPNCGKEDLLITVSVCPVCDHRFGEEGMTTHKDLISYESLFSGVDPVERRKFITLIKQAYRKNYNPCHAEYRFAEAFGYPPKAATMKHALFGIDAGELQQIEYWDYLKKLHRTKGLTLAQAKRAFFNEFGINTTVKQNCDFVNG